MERSPSQLRQRIIDAAIAELAQPEDPEVLSLRAVARRVGISPPAVYGHFANRQQVVKAVIAELFARLAEACDAAAGLHRAPRHRLRARGTAYARFGLDHPGLYKLLFEGRGLAQLDDPDVAALGAPILAGVVDDLRTLGLDAEAADGTGLRLWEALHGAVSLRINKPGLPWPVIEREVRELLDLLLPRPAASSARTGHGHSVVEEW